MLKKINILLLNGPNLNLLGKREPKKYGYYKLSDILKKLENFSEKNNINLEHFQSNKEYSLIDKIHNTIANFILINPAAFTHTSIAIRDALLSVNIPFIEIHITNIYRREIFRRKSFFSDISVGMICGLGCYGYFLALKAAIKFLKIS